MRERVAAVSAAEYRAAMRLWPSGVALVTVVWEGRRHGLTASAFTSVSVEPPLVLVVLDKRSRTHDLVLGARAFGVSLLGADQQSLADRFAGRLGELADRFHDLETFRAVTGAPLVRAAVAYLDCTVEHGHDAGDHTIYVGRVVACGRLGLQRPPLAYHDGAYRTLADLPEA